MSGHLSAIVAAQSHWPVPLQCFAGTKELSLFYHGIHTGKVALTASASVMNKVERKTPRAFFVFSAPE